MSPQQVTSKPENIELGKLYEFEASPKLRSEGIMTQWFITNPRSDQLLAGYVNDRGEWSICQEKNLTPTNNWRSKEQVFSHLKQKEQQQYQEGVILTSDDSGENDDKNQPSTIELEDRQETQGLNQTVSIINQSTIPLEKEEQIVSEPVEGQEKVREQLEKELTQIMVQGSQNNDLNFNQQNSSDQWVLNDDQMTNSIQLIDKEDGHTIISIDREDGLVNSQLSIEDSQKITNLSLDKSDQTLQLQHSQENSDQSKTAKSNSRNSQSKSRPPHNSEQER